MSMCVCFGVSQTEDFHAILLGAPSRQRPGKHRQRQPKSFTLRTVPYGATQMAVRRRAVPHDVVWHRTMSFVQAAELIFAPAYRINVNSLY